MKLKNLITKKKSFKEWKKLSKLNNVIIKDIKYKSLVNRNYCDFSISTIDTTLIYKKKIYKRVVQLEGTSIVIIPIIYTKNKVKTLLVSQFRAPLAKENYEFPSGGAEFVNLKKSAQKEIFEETGLSIPLNKIKQLNRKGIFMLPANNYSRVFFFYFKKKLEKKMINEFNSKIFGKQNDGEFLKIKLVDFEDIFNVSSSASVIIGQTLLKKNGIL